MKSRRGFTLIETLAAGVISTIVGGAMLSILSITNAQIKESIAHQRIGQMQTLVSEQIRNDARKAFGPKVPSEVPDSPFDANPEDDPGETTLLHATFFCHRNGVSFSAYRIDGGILQHSSTPSLGAWQNIVVGGQPVKVTPASGFTVLSGRMGITFKIACTVNLGGQDYTFPLIEETILCRNK